MNAASPSGATHLLEAHEGVHLVDVAMNALGHAMGEVDVRVAGVGEQVRGLAQPPKQPVEEREALGIAVEDQLLGKCDEGA